MNAARADALQLMALEAQQRTQVLLDHLRACEGAISFQQIRHSRWVVTRQALHIPRRKVNNAVQADVLSKNFSY